MPATDANSLVMNAEKSATPAYPLSRCETLVDGSSDAASSKSPTERDVPSSSPRLPAARKLALLALFCLAQFLDVFNNSALFSAIPTLRRELGFDESGATWLISAYQLTFASFLLIAGKIADVYDPKRAFVIGLTALGLLSLGAGFLNAQIPLIVLRALAGIAAAQTIPSALTLLVSIFPEPNEQALAIGVFGGTGAVANILGLFIGALFVEFASWRWVFWFAAALALPLAGLCALLVPHQTRTEDRAQPAREKLRRLDLGGVAILTAALVLFIFAITSGSTAGWKSAMVLAPLVISVVAIGAFFVYETQIPEEYAAIPPRTWFLPNFAVLFGAALVPYFYWTAIFTIYMTLWQSVYGVSPLLAAVHMLPLGVLAFAVSFSGPLARRVQPKWLILGGQLGALASVVMFVFADSWASYWPLLFPAFCIGTSGAMMAYTHNNIAIFRTAPASMSGTVGALFNGALQLGSAVGIAAVTSIESSIEARSPDGATGYAGRRAAWFFVIAVIVTATIGAAVFYRTDKPAVAEVDVEAKQAAKEEVHQS